MATNRDTALEHWLKRNQYCPNCGEKMKSRAAIPSTAVQTARKEVFSMRLSVGRFCSPTNIPVSISTVSDKPKMKPFSRESACRCTEYAAMHPAAATIPAIIWFRIMHRTVLETRATPFGSPLVSIGMISFHRTALREKRISRSFRWKCSSCTSNAA